jgi:hypothetical protein
VTRVGEPIPPFGEAGALAFELTAFATEIEEIPASAVAGVLEQAEWALAGALLEARLQRPDFLDRSFETSRDCKLLCLTLEHEVHGVEQRRDGCLAARLRRVPGGEDFVPQQRREQESRRNAALLADALVGVGK